MFHTCWERNLSPECCLHQYEPSGRSLMEQLVFPVWPTCKFQHLQKQKNSRKRLCTEDVWAVADREKKKENKEASSTKEHLCQRGWLMGMEPSFPGRTSCLAWSWVNCIVCVSFTCDIILNPYPKLCYRNFSLFLL